MMRFLRFTFFGLALIYAFNGAAPLEMMYIGDAGLPYIVHSSTVMEHLLAISRKPHYISSADHERVRTYVRETLKGIGLEAEISEHSMPEELRLGSSEGRVFNVLGKLKGAESGGKAVLFVSHYDSVMTGPGAADDGAAVAAMLVVAEKVKFLQELKSEAFKNDIIFLFTDAEEVCLCGAKAFVQEHRWAKDVGLVLNFEARGNSGPSIMFETSDGNAGLIRAFSEFAPSPSTNSLSYEVYKRLPNDTDLTIFKKAGYPGLNFAFIGGLKYYHSPEDIPGNISTMSIAHHGNNMLAAARYFGNANLDDFKTGGPNAVYFDFARLFIVHYPEGMGIFFGFAAFALWIISLVVGIRKRRFSARNTGFQILIAIPLTLLVAAVAWLLALSYSWLLIRVMGISKLDVLTSKPAFLALLAVCCFIFTRLFRRWNPCGSWFPAAGIWLAIFAPVVPFVIPGASYLFAWPLIFLSMAHIMQFSPLRESAPRLAAAASAVCMLPVIILIGTTLNGVFTAMTIGMLPAEVFIALLLFMPLMGQLMHSTNAGIRLEA